jgi:nucleoside-diphosphate-sugar epimerase
VYTGSDKAFQENDPPNFGFNNSSYSFYSGTKAMSEELLSKQFPNTFIWRLRIPFDNVDSPRNYLTKLMKYDKLLHAANSISHRLDFVDACLDLAECAPPGIYNVVNPGAVTTREVVDMIKSKLNLDKQFEFYDDEGSFLQTVKTPRSNCMLSTAKLLKYVKMRSAKDALDDALTNWEPAQ